MQIKLKKVVQEQHHTVVDQIQNYEVFQKDPTDLPQPKKKKKKKQTIQGASMKKGSKGKKPKKLNKSKGKKVISDDSKKLKSSVSYKRTRYTDIYEDAEAKFIVMDRAARVLSQLDNGDPHCVKCMLPSNVSRGFWLHFPTKFSTRFLPNEDASIVLVDEWGNEYTTSFIFKSHGLSAGWRGFSISHRLLKGDLLIFQLVGYCRLKVHIVRVNSFDVMNAAISLMNLDASRKGADCGDVKKDKRRRTHYVDPFLPSIGTTAEKAKEKKELIDEPVTYPSSSNSDGLSSAGLTGFEIADQPQSDFPCYAGPSFINDRRPRELLTCT